MKLATAPPTAKESTPARLRIAKLLVSNRVDSVSGQRACHTAVILKPAQVIATPRVAEAIEAATSMNYRYQSVSEEVKSSTNKRSASGKN